MKLVSFLVTAGLLFGIKVARADAPIDPYSGDATYDEPSPLPPHQLSPRQRPVREMRRLLIERFDRNQDGRLEPRERRQALRALRRLERKLARQDGRGALRKLIRKYDLNGDGNVDPGEMPPEMARRLRHLDRDGNGWVDRNDFAR
jgi:hypothetical protein